jgi:hypothetical protein
VIVASFIGWVCAIDRPRVWTATIPSALGIAACAAWLASGPDPQPPPRPACGIPPVPTAAPEVPTAAPDDLRVSHDGLSAVLVHPRDEAQLEFVVDMAVDVWSDSWGLRGIVIVVDDAGRERLRGAGIPFEVEVEDIGALAEAERERLSQPQASRPTDWFADYKTFAAVDAYVDDLAEHDPELAEVRQLGESVEGRPIRTLRITDPRRDAASKTTIILNGGQHAREWISVMTTTCLADRLIRRASTDDRIARVLDAHVFFVVPVVNPDGYVYSWEKDRYWRKNRAGDHGVDLNRNWDWAWGERGASKNPRSQIYAGPAPFSEPETRALRDLIVAESPAAHVDLHSFSQLILYPWNHKKSSSPDRARFAAYADRMATAIYTTHGKSYRTIAGADLYPASGTFSDWSYGARGVTSFVFELRPQKGTGFVLPPEEIVPTCDETFAAILELADLVERDAT